MPRRLGPSVLERQFDPVAGVRRVVAPEFGRFASVDDDEVDAAVEIEIGKRRAARGLDAGDPGRVALFDESAVGLLHQQVVGVGHGEIRHLVDIALGDEQVDEAVIVDILELGMPAGLGLAPRRRYRAVGR